jgi:hypothetical protein
MRDMQRRPPDVSKMVALVAVVGGLVAITVFALQRGQSGRLRVATAYDYATELYRDLRGYDEEM